VISKWYIIFNTPTIDVIVIEIFPLFQSFRQKHNGGRFGIFNTNERKAEKNDE
jgi:hypothetical protein